MMEYHGARTLAYSIQFKACCYGILYPTGNVHTAPLHHHLQTKLLHTQTGDSETTLNKSGTFVDHVSNFQETYNEKQPFAAWRQQANEQEQQQASQSHRNHAFFIRPLKLFPGHRLIRLKAMMQLPKTCKPKPR